MGYTLMGQYDTRAILAVVGVLALFTALITENLKKVFHNIIPTEALVVLVAEVLTLVPGFVCAQILKTDILAYHILAAVVAGYGVACTAMHSYDLARTIMRKSRKIKRNKVRGDVEM